MDLEAQLHRQSFADRETPRAVSGRQAPVRVEGAKTNGSLSASEGSLREAPFMKPIG